MLGVFGCVPAFDSNFRAGFGSAFSQRSLKRLSDLYVDQKSIIDDYRNRTLDFDSGEDSEFTYPVAKVIDMIFYREGQRRTTGS